MLLKKRFLNENHGVYKAMQDELSRFILSRRELYSLTGNHEYLREIVENAVPMPAFLKCIPNGSRDYIFGAGVYGRTIYEYVNSNWAGITDNNKMLWGSTFCNHRIIPPSEIPQNARLFVASKFFYQEIHHQLCDMGFAEDQIITDFSQEMRCLEEKQYFDLPELYHTVNEVFIDGGAYDGFSTQMFIKWSSGEYRKIIAFEPEKQNRNLLQNNIASLGRDDRISIQPYGLWGRNETVSFLPDSGGSQIINTGTQTVDVIALDDQPYAKDISFIKMDIEGVELNALQGAEKIIRDNRPKLAICVYHKPEDIYKIPALLLSFQPDYKLYLRHYSLQGNETVLYAI